MSTVPAVMSALQTLYESTLSAQSVTWQIIFGSRDAVTSTGQYVAVVRGAIGDDETLTMELSRSMERYLVKNELSGSIPGGGDETMQTVTENVFAAKTALEHAIRENLAGPDLSLSASGVLRALPKHWEFKPEVSPSGEFREALVTFDLEVTAQNT